ncbi:VOC family protein [Streptomyces sp. NPDC020792]|uniref:VOC family protein n=1 Tax=Streptomyces sp. NPDC020792 TaxID=3365089 RepID=UPI0037B28714
MRAPLTVERLGHVNVFAQSPDAEVTWQQDVFGARVLRQGDGGQAGDRGVLAEVGPTRLRTSEATTADDPGWHSVVWTVPSVEDAVAVLTERGVRVTEQGDGHAAADPADLHGLAVELMDSSSGGDGGPAAGDEHPLGVVGTTVKVVTSEPEKAAADLAALVGQEAYAAERPHLNMSGHGVRFEDHAVEFVASATGSATDLAGGFLAARGEHICWLSFTVKDFLAARGFLVEHGVRFEQFGRHSLVLHAVVEGGARIEITDAD